MYEKSWGQKNSRLQYLGNRLKSHLNEDEGASKT